MLYIIPLCTTCIQICLSVYPFSVGLGYAEIQVRTPKLFNGSLRFSGLECSSEREALRRSMWKNIVELFGSWAIHQTSSNWSNAKELVCQGVWPKDVVNLDGGFWWLFAHVAKAKWWQRQNTKYKYTHVWINCQARTLHECVAFRISLMARCLSHEPLLPK